jgi:hypothetical protein
MFVDGSTFSNIEEKRPLFKEKACNIRLALEANDVNPFSEIRSIYSVWHVFIISNNIPPWMSIKRDHILLEMIIPRICLQ